MTAGTLVPSPPRVGLGVRSGGEVRSGEVRSGGEVRGVSGCLATRSYSSWGNALVVAARRAGEGSERAAAGGEVVAVPIPPSEPS